MTQRDPAKRIPKSLGTEAKLYGTYTLSDLAVALLPGVVLILLVQVVLPSEFSIAGYQLQTITLPLAGVAILGGALFVYLTPDYTTSLDWLGTMIAYHRQSNRIPHEQAKAHTQVERVHPNRGFIERTDGAFLGFVQVEPANMALATDAEWAAKAEAFQDFCNTQVEFPIQLYSTTRAFPVEEYLSQYRSRLIDADVMENPRLASLIEHYIEWYVADLADRQMTIRDHYVVVPVTSAEVQFERESLVQQLARLPMLGLFIRAWLAPREVEEHEAMASVLDERLRRIETGLREIEGCSARRVDAETATRVIAEFWSEEQVAGMDLESVLRNRPVVGE